MEDVEHIFMYSLYTRICAHARTGGDMGSIRIPRILHAGGLGMTRAHLDIRPENVTAIIDTREQLPFDLTMIKSERGTLPTGDYSVKGLEHEIVVERKSLSDLVNCIGKGRDRFEREIQRMLAYKSKLVVVEEPFEALHSGEWFSMVKPNAAVGTVIGWQALGLPFYFARDRDDAAYFTSRFLFVAARRRWREIQSFIPTLRISGGI